VDGGLVEDHYFAQQFNRRGELLCFGCDLHGELVLVEVF
jgi:hypothetical protein